MMVMHVPKTSVTLQLENVKTFQRAVLALLVTLHSVIKLPVLANIATLFFFF